MKMKNDSRGVMSDALKQVQDITRRRFFSQSGSATTPTLTRPDEEHHLVNSVPSATVCARREGLEPTQIEELAYAGQKTFEHPEIYSGTRFNFCQTSSGSRPGKLAEDIEKKIFI